MATPKWFDLSSLDAKVERVSLGRGVFNLRLEVTPDRLEGMTDADLLDAGWVEEDYLPNGRRLLVNHRTMTDTRSIAEALSQFFSRDEIVASRAPQDMMRQNERMDGLEERRIIEEVSLADQVTMVEPESRDRIMKAVMAAAADQRKKLNSEKGNLLDGRGMEVFHALVDHAEKAVAGPSTDLVKGHAAMLGGRFMQLYATKGVDHSGMMETALAQKYLAAKDANDVAGQSEAIAALHDSVQSGRGLNSLSQINVILGEDFAKSEPRERVALAAIRYNGVPIAPFGGQNVRLDERTTLESILRDLPFKTIRDNSMPTRELANYAKALSQATNYVAERLGLEPDALLPEQEKLPLRFNMGAVLYGGNASGVMRHMDRSGVAGTIGEDGQMRRGALTIAVSLKTPGSFVHELAHAIDFGNALSKQTREQILEQSGLLNRIQSEIGAQYRADDEYGQYLRSPHEIFARVFEASMVNHALSKGDRELQGLGGQYAVKPTDHFAARGDFEATEEFLRLVTQELNARRSMAYEKSKGVEREPAPEATQPANSTISPSI